MRSPQLTQSAAFGTTPFNEEDEDRNHMSLDRSPSPRPEGGWSSPGLTTTPPRESSHTRSRGPSPHKRYGELNGGSNVTWDSAKAGSARVNGYPRYESRNQGFFGRSMRRLSTSLPYFSHGGQEDRFAEKEKLGRGRIPGRLDLKDLEFWKELPRRIGLLIARRRKYVAILLLFILGIVVFNNSGECLYARG